MSILDEALSRSQSQGVQRWTTWSSSCSLNVAKTKNPDKINDHARYKFNCTAQNKHLSNVVKVFHWRSINWNDAITKEDHIKSVGEKSRSECVLSPNRQIADQTEDYICMYVWCKNKWMCQRMMDDQGNVLHPCSLIQPAEPPTPTHPSEPASLPHLSRKNHFLCSGAWCLSLLQFLLQNRMWCSQSKYFMQHLEFSLFKVLLLNSTSPLHHSPTVDMKVMW